ncbi:hypothetical protein CC85DRAFT_288394 [Cutaneotrichosporon oleaginosum]|uniref:Uncharacterized protein n=1 Tax=Cutaneotrichosporon oleaginosum TaxID=879819 RepID=A0A0J0XEU3_9TREE|nr:uncharacterized protein CC85DRAFT_288394 [Cutaneotrichosporon oleaginosum]KLT39597.1 hypothetical protein CC85DRAFT_288394 [Cutaneotrichosporon oleaginosum]TXT15475.1 hypothetical protein COLE_01668 [Cutaneotrichosporon oleaginosum]
MALIQAAALAALVEHRNALVLSPAPSDPSTPSSASSTNSVGDSDSDSRGPTTPSSAAIAAVDARARAFAAYKTYLNKLIEARHRLAVLVYERRTRAVLAHNATWTHHIHRAAEAVEVARIGYEAMRVEMEQQGFVI